MIESKGYQLLIIENTIENTLALLESRFQPEAVNTVRPALLRIDDLEKLKQLHIAAARVPNIEAFARMLHE